MMNTCPYCYYPLLRHIRHNDMYWYCSHCRQETPDLSLDRLARSRYLFKIGLTQESFREKDF